MTTGQQATVTGGASELHELSFEDTPPYTNSTQPNPDEQPTTVSIDLVQTYLNKIGETALLTASQEVELAKRIEAGLYAAELLKKMSASEAKEPLHKDNPTEQELVLLSEDGDRAKDHLLRANLRLVASTAKRYRGKDMAFLDLIQEGNLGVIRAVEKFDYAKGNKFSTYAALWIGPAIKRAIANQARMIRWPLDVPDEVNKLNRTRAELQQNGHAATDDELAAE